jgi:peptidoglycan/LPS O-acetylase OafA/YrhL
VTQARDNDTPVDHGHDVVDVHGHAAAPRRFSHVPALDGMRGVAIALVMLYHFNLFHEARFFGEGPWIALADFGWAGVDVFFVLSGFLITSILLDAKDDHEGAPKKYFLGFWMRRVLRIFPLYYLFLFVSFVVFPASADHLPDPELWRSVPSSSWWFWAYVPNFLYAKDGAFFGAIHLQATWSLGVEEQFYLLWPLVVWLVPTRHIGKVAASGVALALVLRVGLAQQGTPWVSLFVWPFTRMDTLFVGIWLAQRYRRRGEHTVPAFVALGLGVFLWFIYSVVRGAVVQFDPAIYTFGYTAIAVTAGALLWLSLHDERVARVLRFKPLRVLGKYAYGLYLVHVPVKHLVLRHLLTWDAFKSALPGRLAQELVFELCGFVVSLACAWLLFHLFEQRFLALKRFFPR